MYDLLFPTLLFFLPPPLLVHHQDQISAAFPVEADAVRQYWFTRCADVTPPTPLPDTLHLFPGLPIIDVYVEKGEDIFFLTQLSTETIPRTYLENVRLSYVHCTDNVHTKLYLVAPDETNPGAARVNLCTQTYEARTTCVNRLPVLAPFKNPYPTRKR